MKFATFNATVIVYWLLHVFIAESVKYQIIKDVNICKRSDPQFQNCFCNNFNKLIPLIKNGVPEMNIIAIEPMQVEHLQIVFPEIKNVHFRADLSNVMLYGLSLGSAANCITHMTENGLQKKYELIFPKIEFNSKFKANGKYLLFVIQGNGDFYGNVSNVVVSSVWNSTLFMKHGKEHLKFTAKFTDLKVEKIHVHFTNMFGNNTALNKNINDFFNANTDLLYDELKPIVMETIKELSLKIINTFYYTFPFDVLFPKN